MLHGDIGTTRRFTPPFPYNPTFGTHRHITAGNMIGLIWAQGKDGAIGANGSLPWRLPEDLAHFRQITAGHPVIMGRRTWDSLPEKFRPLPGRLNVVVTRSRQFSAAGAAVRTDLCDACSYALGHDRQVWIIGGASIYRQALPLAEKLAVTQVDLRVPDADAFAPKIGAQWRCETCGPWQTSRTGIRYRFLFYGISR